MLCFHGTAGAQKMLSGSAWRSVTAFTAIPRHTKVRVLTTESIETQSGDGRVFHGKVAKDVFGGNGNVLIPKGSNVELMVKSLADDRLVLDLNSIETNNEQFQAESSREAMPDASVAGAGAVGGVQISTSGERIEVPKDSLVTFRLNEAFQVNAQG
jgi:hypothetical protein